MLIKTADDRTSTLALLDAIKRMPGLTACQRSLVDQEIRTMKSGIRGEADTAYEIDFHLGKSENTMVLHDLRLELTDGRTAQIDHLLIHRTGQAWVLESKKVANGIKITADGEFLRWNGRTYEGMASPISQNERHIEVLRGALKERKCGFVIDKIHAYVIVSSKARIDRPKAGAFDTSGVVKADQFLQKFDKDLDRIGLFGMLGGIFAAGGQKDLARELAMMHRPIELNYAARFGVSPDAIAQLLRPSAAPKVAPVEPARPINAVPEPKAGLPSPILPAPTESQSRNVHACRFCQSANLVIFHGPYGYYFKCLDCSKNTPIKVSCSHAGHAERIRKDGLTFYRECADCGSSRVFYVNESITGGNS
ncbi:NERD domain-containing protein [Burkholderia cenocepacia]|uniref:nuclease-related domain-containing protein n=1 Tax=Burkholderia cenocepacia TaxID=95486 RepID=UPI001BA05DF7|nr:nuclease-related domain-containing protein [Burkholderia cenocepacia]MBR8043478.1 NERD domain-containing protein [Burkholderia cenocepacia]MBR8329067.1 NERD domain-containing protein [Burkholderia cenocepacia]